MSENSNNSKREVWILISFILIIGAVLLFTEKKPVTEGTKIPSTKTTEKKEVELQVEVPQLGQQVKSENVDLRIREKGKKVVLTPEPPVDFSVQCSKMFGNEVWFGSSENGVMIFDLNSNMWRHIPIDGSADIREIVSMEKFKSKLVLVCRNKLYFYNGFEFSEIIPEGISFDYISSSCVYKGSLMFIATNKGLFGFDGKNWEDYTSYFTSPSVRYIVSDRLKVYALGDNILYRFIPEENRFAIEVNKTFLEGAIGPNNVIRNVKLYTGVIYLGTSRNGAFSYSQTDKIVRSLYASQVDSQFVNTIEFGLDERVYIGTDTGVVGFSPKMNREFKLDYSSGLLCPDIRTINVVEKDGNQALILGTINGVFVYNGISVIPVYAGKPNFDSDSAVVKMSEKEMQVYEKFSENTLGHIISLSTLNEIALMGYADGKIQFFNFANKSSNEIKFSPESKLSSVFSVTAGSNQCLLEGPEGFYISQWNGTPKKIQKPKILGPEGSLGGKIFFLENHFVLYHYEKGWYKYNLPTDNWSEIKELSQYNNLDGFAVNHGKVIISQGKKVFEVKLQNATQIADFTNQGLSGNISNLTFNSKEIYAGDDSGELLCYNINTKNFRNLKKEMNIASNLKTNILCMEVLENSDLFVGTISGLYRLTGKGEVKLFTVNDGLLVNQITVMKKVTQQGSELLLCGNEFGLKRYTGVGFDNF